LEGKKPMKPRGFSLLEILLVVAVMGILVGAGAMSFLRYQRVLVVREAAAQLSTDLLALRTQSRRVSQNRSFSATVNTRNYTSNGVGKTLPVGVTFTQVPTTVTFTAPYGLVSGTTSVGFVLQGLGGHSMQVSVVGASGKVVVRAP
jgi:type IV pilus assembly protein PilA